MSDFSKSPRVYVDQPLAEGGILTIEGDIHHYLKNVMRLTDGDILRLFNRKDGEFSAIITDIGKKSLNISLKSCLKDQILPERRIHLLFTPIKKERMDWLVEKSVELGATDLHPVLTQNTDIRKLNEDRLRAQIIEATEQCERLDLPVLHPAADLFRVLAQWDKAVPVLAALERFDAKPLRDQNPSGPCALLIGPSGGFTEDEKTKLAQMSFVKPVSLGETILRSETAVAAGLTLLTR